MKLGVIGEPCVDFISRGTAPPQKQLGGILYSITALAVISGKDNEIYPVINLGNDEYEFVTSFLSKFKNIKHDFINECRHRTRIVNLYYKNPAIELENKGTETKNKFTKTYDREESSTEPTLPVDFNLVSKALPALDGILINMVSGIDLTLDTMKKIRENFGGYIHMDLHNVVMTTHPGGKREQGAVEKWLEWCSQSDTLQMNESEISVMHTEKMNEYETAEKILSDGKVKSLVITRGKNGVSMYRSVQKNTGGEKYYELDKTDMPGIERNDFKDSTGCGDVFAASFFYKNMQHKPEDFHFSLNYANKMASANSTLSGVEELHYLTA